MKKRACAWLLAAALLLAGAPAAQAAVPDVSAACAVVTDAATGRVLYAKNPDRPMQIASTTKIMTALVVLERCSPESVVTIRPEYTGVEGSSMYLTAGEKLTVRELLYGLLLVSGNDAATALACYTAGSTARFAVMMNEKARELGLRGCHFTNPHGLDEEGHYASAADLARITAVAMRQPLFAQIVSSRSASAGGRTLINHNKLLWLYDGVCGVKTGYTKSAGRSLVSCFERDGMRLICVTLDDPNDWRDHAQLYDYIRARCRMITAVAAGSSCGSVPVAAGNRSAVELCASDDVRVLAGPEDRVSVRAELPAFLYAPVRRTDSAGRIRVFINGQACGSAPLCPAEDVETDPAQRAALRDKLRLGLRILLHGA